MSLDLGGPLLLLGAGKMGGALLEGWLKLGLDPTSIAAIDPHIAPDGAARLSAAGVSLNPAADSLPRPSVILLAIKPQKMAEALTTIVPLVGAKTLLISIMAGKTLSGIGSLLPDGAAIVRAMPNTPAAVGRGITVAVANSAVGAAQRQRADALLRAVGEVEWVDDEALIDAVTALSGSGPAYVFHLVEAMAAAGVDAGLPEGLAMRLARATVCGAGELMHRSDLPAATLRENVTSPAGTTAAALEILMRPGGLQDLLRKAVAAAKRRAGELAG
jgi:pyrroline-5-carboxylate reductase